jgi:hypothetical protein
MKYLMIDGAIVCGALVIAVIIVLGRISYANRHPTVREAIQRTPASSENGARGPERADAKQSALAAAAAEKAAIAAVHELLRSADKLSASSVGVEGREVELKEAKKSLEHAQELLEKLPPENEEVKKLKNAQQELTNRILKGSGFDG